MSLPPGNRKGSDQVAYLNNRSQGPRPEKARLPAHRAYSSERRTVIFAVALGNLEICGLNCQLG